MAEPMTPQRFEVRGRGASDELIERLRQSLRDTAEHEHPAEGRGPDLFCLNQVAFRGEYTAAVLERLRQAEADLARALPRIDAALAYADLLVRTSGQRPEVIAADVAWKIRSIFAERCCVCHPRPCSLLPEQGEHGCMADLGAADTCCADQPVRTLTGDGQDTP